MVPLRVFDKVAGDFTVGDGGGVSTEYWPYSWPKRHRAPLRLVTDSGTDRGTETCGLP